MLERHSMQSRARAVSARRAAFFSAKKRFGEQ
jgi:hypothetical protein